ncbi:MAG: hypothetical protein HFE57_05320 [Firmicutes bacterium]|nr:hypothetical protein [Bacillota bacterium]
MKKIKLLIVLSILLFSFASCKSEKAENIVNETEDIVSKQNNDNKLNDIDDISQEKDKNNEINVFKKLPQNFVFSSGVGNWSTTFDLSPDGTFTGKYTDLDMGDTGEKFPNGTTYICKFNGKFSEPVRIDEYTYSMQLEYLDLGGVPGNIYYEDNMRYICSEAYGFDNAEEFLIYLPETPISILSEDFLSWLNSIAIIKGDTIPDENCGIYNVNGKEGFVGFYEEKQASSQGNNDNNKKDNHDINVFQEIPQHFSFTGSDWSTNLVLNLDGTFTGKCYDLDKSSWGDDSDWDSSSVYYSFDEKFSKPIKVDEYTYFVNLEYLNTEEMPENQYYKDDAQCIYSKVYGFDDTNDFLIYLPKTPTSILPEDCLSKISFLITNNALSDLNAIIYNIKGKECFVGFDT